MFCSVLFTFRWSWKHKLNYANFMVSIHLFISHLNCVSIINVACESVNYSGNGYQLTCIKFRTNFQTADNLVNYNNNLSCCVQLNYHGIMNERSLIYRIFVILFVWYNARQYGGDVNFTINCLNFKIWISDFFLSD